MGQKIKKRNIKRPVVEAVFSFLKTQYSLTTNKVRGLKNVTVHALYSILNIVLRSKVAINIGRPDKAASQHNFNT